MATTGRFRITAQTISPSRMNGIAGTSSASNAAMAKAMDKIGRLPVVKEKPVMLRVESFD